MILANVRTRPIAKNTHRTFSKGQLTITLLTKIHPLDEFWSFEHFIGLFSPFEVSQ